MANEFGRGGVASTGAAQGGPGRTPYSIDPKSAASFLSGAEGAAYQEAIRTLALPTPVGSGGNVKKKKLKKLEAQQTDAQAQAVRLREIAGVRSLGQFGKEPMQHSKPWLMTGSASEGLISSKSITGGASGDVNFDALGVGLTQGSVGGSKLGQIQQSFGGTPGAARSAEFYGDPKAQKKVGKFETKISKLMAAGKYGKAEKKTKKLEKKFGVTNPYAAYGGFGL